MAESLMAATIDAGIAGGADSSSLLPIIVSKTLVREGVWHYAALLSAQLAGLMLIFGKRDNFVAGADISMIAQCQSAEEAEALAQQG